MDLASVVAALASIGVRVSGSTPNSSVQGDSSRACPTGLASPEPSGTINDPGQHFHVHPSQEGRATSRARTQRRTPQHPSQDRRGAAETRVEAHTPTPHTPARSGGVQVEHAHKHTHTPTPQPGVAGRSLNPSPSTHPHDRPHPGEAGYNRSAHTHTPTPQPRMVGRSRNPSPSTRANAAHPSQEWRARSGARTPTYTHPNTPARSGGAQPKPDPKHTHPRRTPQPGVAGYKRSAYTKTHTPTPQPGEAGRSRNPSPSTQTHATHPSQEWRGTSGARTQAHEPPNTPARSGEAQPKPEPKHTNPHRTPQPGVVGYKQSAHTGAHAPQHPS